MRNKVTINYQQMPALNKPIAYMAADVNTLTPVLQKSVYYYPKCSLLETATNASAKTFGRHYGDSANIESSKMR